VQKTVKLSRGWLQNPEKGVRKKRSTCRDGSALEREQIGREGVRGPRGSTLARGGGKVSNRKNILKTGGGARPGSQVSGKKQPLFSKSLLPAYGINQTSRKGGVRLGRRHLASDLRVKNNKGNKDRLKKTQSVPNSRPGGNQYNPKGDNFSLKKQNGMGQR